jgi:chemotaxis protein methyltransferase CheR
MPPEVIDAQETRLVLDAIFRRYGYDFRNYSQDSVRRRLSAAMIRTQTEHLGELMHRLLWDPDYFGVVLSCLTVKVTEMFRDPVFHQEFRNTVVPILRTYPRLRVWHAGCASGEELYAMAILLEEAGLYSRSQLFGTDIDSAAIEGAKDGIYLHRHASTFEQNYVRAGGTADFWSYFTTGYGKISVVDALRRNASFFQHDLVTDFCLGEMQVIFCRNVALYFNAELRTRVFSMFAQGLCRGGFLCLGASETLPRHMLQDFEEYSPQHRIYRMRRAQ